MRKVKSIVLLLACAAELLSADDVATRMKQRNEAYGNELEQYFRDYLVAQYPERAAKAWNRDYANERAFLKSVEPNRERYRRIFSPPALMPSVTLVRKLSPPVRG